MSKTILAFGDSNTFGTPPMLDRDSNNGRYEEDIRWPMVMQKYLDPYWQVIEEGLPGRTTSLADPEMGDHMNGQIGLKIFNCMHAYLLRKLVILKQLQKQ